MRLPIPRMGYEKKYDAIIIGAGQAGPSLAIRLANTGMRVAIIERKYFGGTCVNTGCIPSKTLIASAEVANVARKSDEFGVILKDSVTVDMKKVKERKDKIVLKLREAVEESLFKANCDIYKGHAQFVDSKIVSVNDVLLEADKIFINVGARANIPDIDGINEVGFLTNSSIMDLDVLPEHLIIVGGSYISLEFAQMYKRFGSKVTIIEKSPRLIAHEDVDISQAIKTLLEQEGIEIQLNSNCIAVQKENSKIVVNLTCNDSIKKITGSHLLIATGRKPNTDDLGIEKINLQIDEKGYIKVDDHLKTNIPGIWALGECNGKGPFTHTAYNDYEIVAANLLENDDRKVSDRITAYNLYIDPPLGRVGMTIEQAKNSGLKFSVAVKPMKEIKRAMIKNQTQGFMKILVDDATKKILGASFLGLEADEIIHSILDVMYAKAPYTVVLNAMHIHPTVSEYIPTMLHSLKPPNDLIQKVK